MPGERGHGVGRGTTNRNQRGGSAARRTRKLWLLAQFGNGTVAACAECLTLVDFWSITVDRYPLPGCQGGRYVQGNIRPMCGPCNSSTGGHLGNGRRRDLGKSKSLVSVSTE